jgi:hypothetical protein
VNADPADYTELVELAGQSGGVRGLAMEGSGGYSVGLATHLAERSELVIELDRPARPHGRQGAKSDPIDAVRAAGGHMRTRQPGRGHQRGQQPRDTAHLHTQSSKPLRVHLGT